MLVSSTWQRDSGQVAILSGGGSGHEPADAGMWGCLRLAGERDDITGIIKCHPFLGGHHQF